MSFVFNENDLNSLLNSEVLRTANEDNEPKPLVVIYKKFIIKNQ